MWAIVVAASLLVLSMVAVSAFAHRRSDDVTPTVEAFAEFRAAITPGLHEIRGETATTRARHRSRSAGPGATARTTGERSSGR